MSNSLVVAGVSAGVAHILRDVVRVIPGAQVTCEPVSRLEASMRQPVINLALYEVKPSASPANRDLPSRRPDGGLALAHTQQLRLDYLLTFLGDPRAFEPERMLGQTLAVLSARAQLPGSVVAAGIAAVRDPDAKAALSALERGPGPSPSLAWGRTDDDPRALWAQLSGGAAYQLSLALTVEPVRLVVDAASVDDLNPSPPVS